MSDNLLTKAEISGYSSKQEQEYKKEEARTTKKSPS